MRSAVRSENPYSSRARDRSHKTIVLVRHNPARASVATYRERVAGKRHAQRWPRVRIVPA